jgi:hypothetical protein
MASRAARAQVRLAALAGCLLLALIAPVGASVSAQSGSVTVTVNQLNASGVSGQAVLTPSGNQTVVDMTLSGPGITGNHPTHIHTGTCDNFDPNPLYPLETVVLQSLTQAGKSVTTVNVPLADLQASDYVILVHKSPEELTTYFSCGEIPKVAGAASGGTAVTPPAAMPTPKPGVTTFPISGVGDDGGGQGGAGALALGLGLSAGMLMVGAAFARRRRWI